MFAGGSLKKFILISSVLVLTFSCSKKDGVINDGTDDTSALMLISGAASVLGESLQGGAASPSVMSSEEEINASGLFENADQTSASLLASCSTISYGSCSSGATTRDFGTGGCTRTASSGNSATIYGSVTWTFSGGNGACSNGLAWNTANVSGTATRTTSGHYAETSSGYRVLSYTGTGSVGGATIAASDLTAYTGTSYSGGTTVTFGASNTRSINILGVHRRGLRSNGSLYTFWHTFNTPTPLSVSVSGGNYTISSGVVKLFHNRARITVTNTFVNTTYPVDGSCCYPTGGSIQTQVGVGNPITTTFNSTCGSVSIDGVSNTLPACGGSNL